MKREAIFTHNDLDGLVSALLARLALPSADVFFCDYHVLADLVREHLGEYDSVWFTDLSLRDPDFFEALRAAGKDYYWFDHHASSQPQDFFEVCRIDASGQACGAEVLARYLVDQGFSLSHPLRTLVQYAHDQDLWIRALPEAQDFNDILGTLPVQELFRILEEDPYAVYRWTESMEAARAETQRRREQSLQLAEATMVCLELGPGQQLKMALCCGSSSEVGEALGDERTLVALWDLRDLERLKPKFHFRTKSPVLNAARIAEQLGGGGHPRASGAPADLAPLKVLTEALARRVKAAAESCQREAEGNARKDDETHG